jgi:hypothetical protein
VTELSPSTSTDAIPAQTHRKRAFIYGGFIAANVIAMVGWLWFLVYAALRLVDASAGLPGEFLADHSRVGGQKRARITLFVVLAEIGCNLNAVGCALAGSYSGASISSSKDLRRNKLPHILTTRLAYILLLLALVSPVIGR